MKKPLILLVFIAPFALAEERSDTLQMVDGRWLAGSILSASNESVYLETSTGTAVYHKSAVKKYVFACSDNVITAEGDTVHCKVVRADDDTIVFVSVAGTRAVPKHGSRIEPKSASGLSVTELPATDSSFRPFVRKGGPKFAGKVYGRVGYGFHSGVLEQWQQIWRQAEAPTSGSVVPVEVGVILGDHWSLGAGYEHFKTKTLSGSDTWHTFVGDLAYNFYFAALRFQTFPLAGPRLSAFGAGDLGIVESRVNLVTTGGLNFVSTEEASSTFVGVRLRAGFFFMISEVASFYFEGRLLIAKGDYSGNELNFSGPGGLLGIEFHFPI